MSDDATQPPSSFYGTFSRSFAKFTHFIDENIRIIQYGVYCAGAAGLVITLHSVRAFTKFRHIQEIPIEFITKHVRLHGHVKWMGLSPPEVPPPSASPTPTLLLQGADVVKHGSKVSEVPAQNESVTASFSTKPGDLDLKENEVRHIIKSKPKSLSADNRGIYEGAGELHPWENGIDPDVNRIEYDEELLTVYLQVDHTPAISFLRKRSPSLLPLQLADVEVSKAGFVFIKKELMDQRAWFTLVSHDSESDILNAWVRPAKFAHRRSINERLLREGFALTAPMDLDLHHDKQYVKQYMKFLKAQEYAEKKKVGLWKPPAKPSSSKGVFRSVISRLKAIMGRKQ